MTSSNGAGSFGRLLRHWRTSRRLSQLELSNRTGVSTRHLSYLETGRSRPTAAMVERLSDELDVPRRARNALLVAAGYAPAYPEHGLDAPQLAAVRAALARVLELHEPYPAVLLDGGWNVVDANAAAAELLSGCTPELLVPPVNVLRVSLHPDGLAPRIVDLASWRAHLLGQLRRRIESTGSAQLIALERELHEYDTGDTVLTETSAEQVVLPLRLRTDTGELAFLTMASRVETARDVTVDDLTVEVFYPADDATAAAVGSEAAVLRRPHAGRQR